MSGLVIAPNIELKHDMKVTDTDLEVALAAATASSAEPDSDAIKMFVGQIPRNWNETDCRRLFETYGPVFSCNILRDKSTQSSRGCCFVTFFHRKDAIDAQGALHNIKIIDGMHHPVQMKPADTENRNERKLFIGQLSKRHSEEDLKTIFSKYGQIEDCSVLRDQDGKSRGCAFVTFANRSCAVVATKEMHHSQTMEGCAAPLVVKFADTQKDKDVKQKFVGGSTSSGSPKSGILNSISPALIQQLGGSGNNVQTVASILSLLGGQQPMGNSQQNVLGLLGSVLSALGKLTESGGTSQESEPKTNTTSGPSNSISSTISSSSSNTSAATTSVDSTAQLAHLLPQAQPAPLQLEAYAQAQNALIAQQNQILALQGFSVQQHAAAQGYLNKMHYPTGSPDSATNTDCSDDHFHDQHHRLLAGANIGPQWAQRGLYPHGQFLTLAPSPIAAFGMPGGLAGAKTTSPVAATLANHTPIALTPFAGAGAAAIDPYQAVIQQQYAMLANFPPTAITATQSVVGNGDLKGPDGANLFIYHLPQDFGDADLLSTFSPFGVILSAKVYIDKMTNLSKCFGFVSFDNPTSASNAIQAMNGFQIGSKRLKVQLKVDRGNPYNR